MMFNNVFCWSSSTLDWYQRTNFDGPKSVYVDEINIDSQLFWAANILIVNSCIMFNKKVECYERLISWFWAEMLKKIIWFWPRLMLWFYVEML